MTAPQRIELTKHHGLGNDFLVWVLPARMPVGLDLGEMARRLCDRHRGVGADGLIVAAAADVPDGQADVVMVLHNADGSRAEMSGNGIRCLAQALVRARPPGSAETVLRIATDAGVRLVTVGPDPGGDPATVWASVDMGPVRPGREPAPLQRGALPAATPHRKAASFELGNPHLVLLVDEPEAVDLAVDGPRWEARFPEGCNVHFVRTTAGDRLAMRSWERGAGVTEACGTGATAAAAAAAGWGLTGAEVTVAMPGGEVQVRLGPTAVLAGPATWIAEVAVLAETLAAVGVPG